MSNSKDLIQQLQSSCDFLHDLWFKTKDPKQSEQIKRELLDAQEQLRRVKNEYV